ncbi:hypothetical protein P168DRAFT_338464 [Aspergillus campestris IBT 28561]|uniref:Uncharacterized protein n=1 Tax=Aspergillus campestris (strain IBT 28561) TaxID=1392248 RepID=A0A2I1DC57_ASPC2|nr:uncharacterized protein P168DRAFT_338464 [Aspergillus campestris IBT 28561]PKY07438.1 hypothetical protein P168DRAFT_338464 [Aspergillus campestris IBT 28561]
MGVDSRRPILPAPTESIVASTTATDLATDLSRRTDKTSYSIPDDGSPVTIPTPARRRSSRGNHDAKLSSAAQHHSQTSLLIEYFEGGKGSGSLVSRPSVRVRVTPSSGRKAKDHHEHNIQISEAGSGARQPTYTRRISFSSPSRHKAPPAVVDDQSVTSSASATDDPSSRAHPNPPVEIELMDRDPGSELSTRSRYVHLPSDISSMPADSMIDSSSAVRRKRSTSMDRDPEPSAGEYLKTPSRRRSRSLSHERIAHRVAEKLSSEPREAAPGARPTATTGHGPPGATRPIAMSADDEMSPVSSLLSTSGVSSHRKSGDQYSFRSGTSKSSINNPKLLETVEDAIRRLILPELKELKKDQRVASNSSKFDRDMSASYSSAGGGTELGRRLSKHASAPDVRKPTVVLHGDDGPEEGIVLAEDSGSSSQRDRRASRDSDMTVDGNPVKWGLRPDLTEQDKLRRQRSKGLRDAEKAGRVGSALTAAALRHHDSRSSLDREEEEEGGTRRMSGSRNRTGSGNETELLFRKHNVAPMPLRSAIESDLTRDSLLSERTAEPAGRHDLGLHHSNLSSHNLSIHSVSDQDPHDHHGAPSPVGEAAAGAIAAAAAANLLEGADADRDARRRTLSPIQSVASDRSASLRRGPIDQAVEPRLSIDSLSSAPSTNLARSTRQANSSVASQAELRKNYTDRGPELGYEESSGLSPREHPWPTFAGGDDVDPRYSQAETVSTDGKRWTADYTDDSEVNYLEKAHQARPVAPGSGTSPQFVQPIAVESAVASLLDPSILDPSLVDTKSNPSGVSRSQGHLAPSPERVDPATGSRQGSPLKQQQDATSPDATSFPRRMGASSPPQSVTQSLEDPHGYADDLHTRSPSPEEDTRSPDLESEINTNPSIIQGPAAPHENHWYGPTDPTGHQSPLDQTGAAGLDYGQDDYSPTGYSPNGFYDRYPRDQLFGTPLGAKDEGYVSAANPRSPGADTPEPLNKGFDMDSGAMGLFDAGPDSFAPGHHRQLSGYSHGAGSPLYDSATGRGIERIQSKDIVALMDHLTVRDAQRNARDTEILMTLVQSATEMRNSFEGMKKFIAQQDGLVMEANEKQHERTYRAVGGPRPLPVSTRPRTAADPEDLRSKRMNVFKRAMKGLHLKSGNDLGKIEDMLEQLLDEVEALRYGDDHMARSQRTGSVDPEGYEPEGHAGTTSSENHSGYLSMFSRPADGRGPGPADQRVSTVPEADEPVDGDARAGAARVGAHSGDDPAAGPVASGALSTEHTPKSTEKARKHKSSSSSFFPKISRWSKTTASSMGDNIRNSIQPARKERGGSFEASPSGSDLGRGSYDAAGDDRMRTSYSLDENRPPSPLVPSQVSEAPKYRAHRDSLDMQHPQPRQGPTGRYQTQLETQAQVYDTPAEPWGSVGSANQRYSGGSRLSPISDVYSEGASSRAGPPRPPKVKDEGPLIPERPPKVSEGSDERSYVERVQVFLFLHGWRKKRG